MPLVDLPPVLGHVLGMGGEARVVVPVKRSVGLVLNIQPAGREGGRGERGRREEGGGGRVVKRE